VSDNILNKVAVLIPSLDPDETLVKYTKELAEAGFTTIIVVNDGSKPEKEAIFDAVAAQGVTVLHHAVNQGKGRGLKTGFHYFLRSFTAEEMYGVVTADADGQHSVEDTVKVAKRLAKEQALVLGTRCFSEENVPFKSRSGNRLTTLVFKLLYGKTIHDTQTGLRGIPYPYVADCLRMDGERFEYETAMLIDAIRSKMNMVEEPIQTIYINSNRETHFSAVRDSLKIYRVIFRCFFKYIITALLSFVIDIGLFFVLTKTIFGALDVKWAVLLGTVIARICSSLFNYTMNKNVTFESKGSGWKTMLKYYLLCAVQALLSWVLVTVLFSKLQWDTTVLKMLVDTLLFFFSYQIQRLWVFKEEA